MPAARGDGLSVAELPGKTLLVGVGGMRCGTSWLHQYLGSLPGVVVSPIKELHFFNAKFPANSLSDMDAMALKRLEFHTARQGDAVRYLRDTPAFQGSVDRAQMIYDDSAYFRHFARISQLDTAVLCDITPAYAAIGEPGFAYMQRFVSDHGVRPKALFVMRDPIDRLWSQLRHMQRLNPEAGAAWRWREAVRSEPIMARADYRVTIEAMEASFPAEDICCLFYEDLFSQTTLERLCGFAGAPFRPGRIDERANVGALAQELPPEARLAFQEALSPQYAYCRDRFGDRLPESWAKWWPLLHPLILMK